MLRFCAPALMALLVQMLPGSAGAADAGTSQLAKATFAGGCFWRMEGPFESLDGVVSVTVGYTGGTKGNPTYGQVSAGGTGHAESVEIAYNPSKISDHSWMGIFFHTSFPA